MFVHDMHRLINKRDIENLPKIHKKATREEGGFLGEIGVSLFFSEQATQHGAKSAPFGGLTGYVHDILHV